MVSMNVLLSFTILMVAQMPVSVTAASAEIFPSLRKKRAEKEKQLAAQKHEENQALPVQAETAKNDASVVVPAAVDVGSDGFPQLPAVSTMLSEASGTLKSVNSQATSLEAKVVQAQMGSEARMAKQKAAFEEKLKQQESGNRLVIEANNNITNDIKQLKASNAALKKHAREVQETNRVMRMELHTVQSRLGTAKEFAEHSLKSTDDSKNSLLQVLEGGRRHRHRALVETSSKSREVDDDDEDDDDSDKSDDDDEDDADSFLSVSQKTHRADGTASFMAAMSELESAVPAVPALPTDAAASPGADKADPNDLLEVLAKDVAHLALQEKESEKKLKNLFIRDFRAGAKRHQALLAQQKSLIATRGSLLTLQSKLKDAEAHLEMTRQQLESRLHGIGQFLQKLAHFSMAPQREVSHLMEVLPKAVAIPKVEKKKFL